MRRRGLIFHGVIFFKTRNVLTNYEARRENAYEKTLSFLMILVVMFLATAIAEAKNADLSLWLKNISESALETEPGHGDSNPEIAVVGSTVHVMWTTRDRDAWTPNRYVYYRRSLDGGATWEPKKLLFTDTDNDSTVTNSEYRRMAVDGNNVHIFVNHYRGEGANWYGVLTYFRSTDNGATFEAERDVATANLGWHIKDIYVSAEGGKVTVGYRYMRNTWYDDNRWPCYIIALTSEDNGSTFTPQTAAYTEGTPYLLWDMQAVGNKIYMLFSDPKYYVGVYSSNLYVAASSDRGAHFTVQRISVPASDGNHKTWKLQDYNYSPKIAIDGDYVHVVWLGDDSEGTTSLFYRRSTDSGVTFDPVVILTNKTQLGGRYLIEGLETIAAKGGKVYVPFITASGQSWGSWVGMKMHMIRSLNNGASFEPLQQLSSDVGITTGGWWPVIALDPSDSTGSIVHVLANPFIYVNSRDAGATFTGPVRLDTAFGSNSFDGPKMAIGPDGAVHSVCAGHITWYSEGVFGDRDIFYRRYNPITAQATPIGNKSLSLRQIYNFGDGTGNERYDTMQIPSSPDVNFTTAMTVEGWIKPDRADNDDAYFIYKPHEEDVPWVSYALGQWRSGTAEARIGTTDDWYVVGGGDPLPNNEWSHIAMTYDANGGTNNFKLYVNGNLVGSKTATGNLKTGSKGQVLVGGGYYYGYRAGNEYHGVDIDELRFWNRALSQEEIAANMYRELTGTESGLTAYYNFNEPISQYGTVRDVTVRGNNGVLMYKERLVAGVVYAKYTLTVTKSGTGSGTVSATGCTLSWTGNTGTCTVDSGTQITLTATPDVGSTFDGWSNGTGSASGCSGTGICTFTITEDSGITATFTALTPTPTPTPTATPTPTPVSGGSIYGYVLDIKEEPVEGVKLKLKGLRTGYTAKEFSDEDGYFEFNDLEADTYRIIAKKRGYRQETKRVKLGEGESKEIEIVMRRTSRKTTLTEGVASTEGLR